MVHCLHHADISNTFPLLEKEMGVERWTACVLLFCLFMHSAKSSIAQEERLAASPSLITRLHLPHAIIVRLHVIKPDVVVLAGSFGI